MPKNAFPTNIMAWNSNKLIFTRLFTGPGMGRRRPCTFGLNGIADIGSPPLLARSLAILSIRNTLEQVSSFSEAEVSYFPVGSVNKLSVIRQYIAKQTNIG